MREENGEGPPSGHPDEVTDPAPPGEGSEAARVALRTLIVTGVVALVAALAALLVLLFEIVLVVFGGLLLAVLLRALSDPLARRTFLSPGWAVTVVIVGLTTVFGVSAWLAAPTVAAQIDVLAEKIPDALEQARSFLERYGWGERLVVAVERAEPERMLATAGDVFATGGMLLVYLLTFFFVGLFVAARPGLYVGGLLHLIPPSRRRRGAKVLVMLGRTLRWFLIGRVLAMTMVGLSTWAVLALIGVPLAALLGLVAGLLTFAPYLGPILGGIPILFVALLDSPALALWAIAAYTGVQWIEGYILDPLIQQRMVELPPAVTVTAQVVLGILAGGVGIALATPLAAVLMVLVQMIWVQGALNDPIHVGPRGFGRASRR